MRIVVVETPTLHSIQTMTTIDQRFLETKQARAVGGDKQADAEVAIVLPLATRRCRGRRVWR
jgi:hypothetical protein